MADPIRPNIGDIWYRIQDRRVGAVDQWGELVGVSIELAEFRYTVVAVTPKGVWLSWGFGGKDRFVLMGAKKRFAHPSKEEALKSFMARKACQMRILEKQLRNIHLAHSMANGELSQLAGANTHTPCAELTVVG